MVTQNGKIASSGNYSKHLTIKHVDKLLQLNDNI